eukprot:Skav229655  [mRNA]  locus=scaffold649:435562:437210:- [translate_table: standard]
MCFRAAQNDARPIASKLTTALVMTSLFYRLYPKDAAIPDHTVTPAARWAKILANGGTVPQDEEQAEERARVGFASMETRVTKEGY